MEELSTRLRGEELRREAEAWRRFHAAAAGVPRQPIGQRARKRLGRRLVHLGERLGNA
jgi:hypothetical protein